MSDTSGVFTLGCSTLGEFADGYRAFLKKRDKKVTFFYIPDRFSTAVKTANVDVYLVEGVATFANIKAKLPSTSVVVVADTPLLLTELPDAVPLDYDVANMLRMVLKPIKYAEFEAARLRHLRKAPDDYFVAHPVDVVDKLGLVIDKTAGGNILSPLNSITFQLTHSQREDVRKLLYLLLFKRIKISDFKNEVLRMTKATKSELLVDNLDKLTASLSKKFEAYSEAIKMHSAGRSINTFCDKRGIAVFEVKWLSRLVSTYKTDEDRGKAKKEAHV